MKVLFAASEIYPYAKTGGLADVADALPKSLKSSVDIAVVMPLYGFMSKKGLKEFKKIDIDLGGVGYEIKVYMNQKALKHYFIEAPLLSTTANLYGEDGKDYGNNDIRFGIFCKAVASLCEMLSIDILHINDWHTALAALFIKESSVQCKSVFTIHNLAYQGIFPYESLSRLGIDDKYFTMDGLEFYGQMNLLKAGIAFCDTLTTVSPTYAKEILTPDFGCGLDGFLRHHQHKLSGILNGINTEVFNPKKDKYLKYTYDHKSLEKKYENKKAFLKTVRLKDPRKPLFIVLSRLVAQKGIDLLIETLPSILEQKLNLFVLGDGDNELSAELFSLSSEYDNLAFANCYDEKLSHQAYGAADFLIMPSRFEPCGLVQMIAMRYGALPIVHATGGLVDSVFEEDGNCGQGLLFDTYSKKAFLSTIFKALALRKKTDIFKQKRAFNISCDFSFDPSAKEYLKLYESLG